MHEPAVYDVALDLLFVEQKLTRVAIEERFFAFFPKPLFLKFLRDAGTAHIDRGLRRAEIAEALPGGEAAALLPTASTIRTMLGAPSDRSAAAGTLTLHYDYRPAGPTGPRMKPIAVIFIFDVTTGRLQVLDIRLPAGSLHFNLAAPAAG
jgi:hypothetical protein